MWRLFCFIILVKFDLLEWIRFHPTLFILSITSDHIVVVFFLVYNNGKVINPVWKSAMERRKKNLWELEQFCMFFSISFPSINVEGSFLVKKGEKCKFSYEIFSGEKNKWENNLDANSGELSPPFYLFKYLQTFIQICEKWKKKPLNCFIMMMMEKNEKWKLTSKA